MKPLHEYQTPETQKVWHATIDWCNKRDAMQDPQHVALANLAESLERRLAACRECMHLTLAYGQVVRGSKERMIETLEATKP
jgi:hypothetical protein